MAKGKSANVRVKRMESDVLMIRVYGAHERVSVKRATNLADPTPRTLAEREGTGVDSPRPREAHTVADIEYKGWTIKPQSTLDRVTSRWRPRALLILVRDGLNQVRTNDSPLDVTAENQSAADTYAVALAQAWIDSYGNGSVRGEIGEPARPA